MTRHPLPAPDAAWLHMDQATNPMVVNALVLMSGQVDHERMATLLRGRIVDRFPRFHERVTDPVGRGPAFEHDPAFDFDSHLHRLALPAPGRKAQLQALVSDLVTTPLDPSRPLWQAYLIEGYGNGAAILMRIHHCIADGIVLARLLMSVTDEGAAAVGEPSPRREGNGLLGLAGRALGAVRGATGAAVHEGMETLAHPGHLLDLTGTGTRDVGTLAKLIGSPGDARTRLKGDLVGTRRVAWTSPYSLARIKAAGRREHGTINDLLIGALTGALHEYLGERHTLPEQIHAMVPFNLRPLDEPLAQDLGNDFALILLALPVGIADRRERVREVRARMNAIKGSHEGPISYGILSAMGMTPSAVEDRLIGFFTDKASMVVTNVPGPRTRLHLAGAPVKGVMVWAPCSGSIGLTVSIFSYAGKVTVGFMADVALVPDPEPLARAFNRELRVLCDGVQPRARHS